MKKTLLFLMISTCVNAQERITTPSGKIVILNTDYTWKYEGQQNSGKQFFSEEFLLKNRSSNVTDMSKYFLSKGNVETENFDDSKIIIQYSILIDLSQYNLIKDKTILNKITKHVINDASYNVKNKYTFKPRKITFFPQEDNSFRISLEYTAENDLGANKTGDFSDNIYDFLGNFLKKK